MMKQYRFTLVLVFVAMLAIPALRAQSSCYVRLKDASGYTPTTEQIEALEQAAAELCLAFDSSGFGGQFKVYDFGFYLHHSATTGGYPEPFAQKVEEVAALSPYYLLFGKQSDRSGVYTRFWVEARLPDSLSFRFPCLDTIGAGILRTSLGLTANIEYEALGKMPFFYHLAEIRVMNKLKAEVDKLRECCYNQQRGLSSCDAPCLNYAEIKKYYEQKGFISIPISIVGNISKPTDDDNSVLKSNNNIVINDYANKIVNLWDSQYDIYLETTENYLELPGENKNFKALIIDNETFCNNFEEINHDIDNYQDYDFWSCMHIWSESEASTEGLLLYRIENKLYPELEGSYTISGYITCGNEEVESALEQKDVSRSLIADYVEGIFRRNRINNFFAFSYSDKEPLDASDLWIQIVNVTENENENEKKYKYPALTAISSLGYITKGSVSSNDSKNMTYANYYASITNNNRQKKNTEIKAYTLAYTIAHEFLHQLLVKAFYYVSTHNGEHLYSATPNGFAGVGNNHGIHYDCISNLNESGPNAIVPESYGDSQSPQGAEYIYSEHMKLIKQYIDCLIMAELWGENSKYYKLKLGNYYRSLNELKLFDDCAEGDKNCCGK